MVRDRTMKHLFEGFKTITVDPGNVVVCDMCNTDLTDSDESGGFLFSSYAIGPCCAEQQLASIRSFNEERYIREHCPKGKSFADWVREDLR